MSASADRNLLLGMLALQLGENGGNGDIAVTELEMDLIETNSDFWKG